MVAFVRGNDLYVSGADGNDQRRLAQSASSPAWSPDGRKIAFVHGTGTASDVYVIDGDGSGLRRVTRTATSDEAPVWSPNGRQIALARKIPFAGIGGKPGVGGNFEIFVMNADGSGQRRLTHEAARDYAPAWSADGRWIAFERKLGFGGPDGGGAIFEVWAVSSDGKDLRRLALGGPYRVSPATQPARPLWSPNGRLIAYVRWSAESRSYDVYVINADGSGLTNVTRSKADESAFAWSPVLK
jgi:TolB protein